MKRLLYLLPLLLIGCRPVINLTSQEYVRVDYRDTIQLVKLIPQFVKIQTHDTSSHIETMYAFSDVLWSSGILTHSIGNKAVEVPVEVQIKTIYKDKTVKVNELTKEQASIIKEYPKLKQDVDKLQSSNSKKTGLIWKLIGALSLGGLWILRKPIIAIASKLIKPL